MAWRFWMRHFGALLRLLWLPCLTCGAICATWWAVRSSFFFFGVDFCKISIDLLFGALMLFLLSMMRSLQLDYLFVAEQNEQRKPQSFLRNFVAIAKNSLRPYVPALALLIIAYILIDLPLSLEANAYVFLPLAVIAVLILPPVAGIMQAYMEQKPDVSLLDGIKESFGLMNRYLGGVVALWIIALLLIFEASVVLLFGEAILECAIANSRRATVQEEVIVLPSWLPVLRYALIVVCMGLLAFMSVVWSLPQQVHTCSILHKETLRKQSEAKDVADKPANVHETINT